MDVRTAQDRQAVLESLLNEARIEANELRTKLEWYRRLIASTRLVMGHEVRRPATAIAGYLELAVDDMKRAEHEQAIAYIEKARAECDLLSELNTFYLELLRSDPASSPPAPARVDVTAVIEDAIDQLPPALNARQRVRVRTVDELSPVPVNESALRIIVMNLLENGLRYSANEAPVSIDATVSRDQRGGGERDLLKLRVVDSGCGIAPDDLKRVFLPFVRIDDAAGAGSGLGLTLVRSLVDMCDGDISARSENGAGTTFFVTLPLTPAAGVGEVLG